MLCLKFISQRSSVITFFCVFRYTLMCFMSVTSFQIINPFSFIIVVPFARRCVTSAVGTAPLGTVFNRIAAQFKSLTVK